MSKTQTDELILLNNVCRDEAIAALGEAEESGGAAAYARAYALLLESGAEENFASYVTGKILYDDNLFARRACTGELTPNIERAYLHDLAVLQELTQKADAVSESIAQTTQRNARRTQRRSASAFRREMGVGEHACRTQTVLPRKRLRHVYRKQGVHIFGKRTAPRAQHFRSHPLRFERL